THDAGTFQAGTLTLGDTAGDGNLIQNDGLVHLGTLRYGPNNNKGGAYTLNGGMLRIDGDILEVAESVGTAQLYVDGGTLQVTGGITLQSFRLGNAAGTTGSYTLPAGQTINNTGTMFVGNNGTGELTVNDTSCLITVKNSLRVAAAESANSGDGTLNFQAGTIDVTGGGMYLGGQDAASNESNTIGTVIMGTPGGNLTDAQLFTSGANLEVGRGGKGYFTQDSGTVTVKTNNLIIGQAASAVGTYTMNGGKLVLQATGTNGSIRVGNTGKGTFIQNDGEVVANIVDLANVDATTSIGTYTMNGGTLTTSGMLVIGRENQGTFEVVGGTMNIGGALLVGGTDTTGANDAPHADGTMVIGSASTSPVLNLGQFEIGRHNVGVVTQNSGTVSVNGANNLVLSQYANGNGTYNMTGGELLLGTGTNGNINFNQGTGLFDQTGGLVKFNGGSVKLGNNPTSQSTYKLRGGTLDLGGGDVAVGSGNETFEFSGGRLMNVGQFNMPMSQLGGTLAPGGSVGKTIITGAYNQSAGATLEIELDGLAGPGVTGGNDVLQVNQGVSLNGILDVLVNFPAPENAVFQILLANGSGLISGTFQTPDGLELTEGTIFYGTGQGRNPFLITYIGGDGNDVTLTVVPEPASALLLLLSLPAVATRLRRRGLARRPG
ncbi:MAG TPA: PEP-CTERM sorting domain-containing protein, partial [Phycisphaerae bacterium]|nr:PEP-CTERM sorting domain-containing protein [Phycisphaerae bacterium]